MWEGGAAAAAEKPSEAPVVPPEPAAAPSTPVENLLSEAVSNLEVLVDLQAQQLYLQVQLVLEALDHPVE